MSPTYTREALIDICERAIVPHDRWSNRDTPDAQKGVGEAWALLKAGCDFTVIYGDSSIGTDDRTIWLRIAHDSFVTFDYGGSQDDELIYLPTPKRIDANEGKDWY